MTAPTPPRLVRSRLLVLAAFGALCALFVAVLWSAAGGVLPGHRPYVVSVEVDNVRNLVPFSDVQIAGVPVGRVETVGPAADPAAGLRLDLALDDVAVPLHDGVRVQVSEKSLAGQYYVDLVDGQGPEIPTGTTLPAATVVPPTDLRDVIAAFDPATREALGGLVRSLDTGTQGRAADVSALLAGLGDLGRDGATAVDAIAAQSADLTRLVAELGTLTETLDTGQGQIVTLVENADRIAAATAGQAPAVEESVRALPGLLAGTRTASGDLTELARALSPVAADLRRAAPDVDAALRELPGTTADLRGLLPALQGVLDDAPATLDRVPAAGEQARALVPPATELLRDLNPALRYLEPYGADVAQFVTNFGAGIHHHDEYGQSYIALQPVLGPYALRPNPVPLPPGVTADENAYPAPGSLADRRPQGPFTRLERDDGPR